MTARQVAKALKYERQFAGVRGTYYHRAHAQNLAFALRYLRAKEGL